jgi:hypothetical protein
MLALPDRLQRTRETHGERLTFHFDNGLVVHTDRFMRPDRSRILPLGGFQDVILNRLVCHPEIVRGKRVFEPFAGSGVFGLMALKLNAAHVDFLDVNPRAALFQHENARANEFAKHRYRALLGSISDFRPSAPYDLVLANPPFVPTPDGIAGTRTSNGGPLGNTCVDWLLRGLDRALSPRGEAFVYLMQLVERGQNGKPLVYDTIERHVTERSVELTPMQQEPLPLADYVAAYRRWFPGSQDEIERWEGELYAHHPSGLSLQHYVMHVQPRRPGATRWHIRDNLAEKFGAHLGYPATSNEDLAHARVLENVIPGT